MLGALWLITQRKKPFHDLLKFVSGHSSVLCASNTNLILHAVYALDPGSHICMFQDLMLVNNSVILHFNKDVKVADYWRLERCEKNLPCWSGVHFWWFLILTLLDWLTSRHGPPHRSKEPASLTPKLVPRLTQKPQIPWTLPYCT